ncbi:hypothetical protein [Aquabacterium sp.]|uniref:hypothetical protein n=1 Tax=Aquabacterium sp. TaxID=1872578 RepID=UPI0025BD1B78|nr:hypothetical protein [Aquabacterium sp.]
MALNTLAPNKRISLTELQQAFAGKGWESIIPTGLSDDLLVKLAYEFRALERYMLSDDEGEPPSLTIPTYVVAAFLAARRPAGSLRRQVQFSEPGLEQAIRAYLQEMERVIVGRITGVGGTVSSEEFAHEMEAAAKAI